MKKIHWLLGSCVAATFTVAACGDDNGGNGGGGEAGSDAGTGGESGSATTGGTGGKGGGAGSSNGGSGATGGSRAGDGGAGDGGTGEGGAGEGAGGAGDGGAGSPSGGTGGRPGGAGGMTAGSGGVPMAGFGGTGGTTAGGGGSAGKAGGAGTAGAGGSAGTSAGAGGGAGTSAGAGGSGGGTCTEVSPVGNWIFDDDNSPGTYAFYGAFLQPNLGGPTEDFFDFEFFPPTGGQTGTFQLGQGINANYATCSQCFRVIAAGPGLNDDISLLATSGTLVITAESSPMTGVIHATLTNATFVEITIHPTTFVSTPVPNGLCAHVSNLTFAVPPL